MLWTRTPVDLAGEPVVPLDQIKRHCRIYGNDDDAYLTELLIPAAANVIARDTRWNVHPALVSTETRHLGAIRLPGGPFHHVVSAAAIDADGGETTIDVATIRHDDGLPGCIIFPTVDPAITKIRLAVQLGSHPPAPELAILLCTLVAHWYEHREAVTMDGRGMEIPIGYAHIVRAMDPMTDGVRVAGG